MRKIAVFLIPALAVLFAAGCEVRVRPGIPPGQAYPPDAVDAVTEPSPARTVIRTVVPQREYVFYIVESGVFELPITGASGYAAIFLSLHEGASESSNVTSVLPPGQGFTILGEYGQWWYIAVGNVTGWVLSKFCMINLPDVIPSIVYNITNHSYSLFRSSGRDIPNITGAALYHSRDFNARLGREEYIAPVLYGMARKIGAAQQAALAQGNTLIMYEAFRPADAHNAVYENLHRLHIACPIVYAGMSTPPWNTRWFLAASPYNHQRGRR
ncbi:MAG: SH3 domain-containing protein [Treponema sp.]|nr:SH3 domain-containing protein [Treponema sp.]